MVLLNSSRLLPPLTNPCPTAHGHQDTDFAEVSAVLLDTGDVLYDATIWWRWVVQQLNRMGLHSQFETLYCVWRREFLSHVNAGHEDYWWSVHRFLRSLGFSPAQVDEVVVAARPRFRPMSLNVRALPGVAATLSRLRARGFQLSILCHTPFASTQVEELLKTLGIRDFFESIACSVEIGQLAGDPQSFLDAAHSHSLSPHEIAFVGHATDELAAAATAGLHTIAFNHESDSRSELVIDQFGQLEVVLCRSTVQRKAS